MSEESQRIINESHLDNEEKRLVQQIIDNMFTRGLLWYENQTDITIATTECVVLTNCLRNLWQERQKGGIQIPCQHDWNKGESGLGGNTLFTCSKCGLTEMDN